MPRIETNCNKVVARLAREGWVLVRHGKEHDVFRHAAKPGTIVVPRHRILSPDVGRSIAKLPGWV